MSIVLIVNNYYTMRFQPDCHCILILLHEESYIMCCPRAQQLCMHQHTCGNFNFQGMLVMLHVEKATGVVWGREGVINQRYTLDRKDLLAHMHLN